MVDRKHSDNFASDYGVSVWYDIRIWVKVKFRDVNTVREEKNGARQF